MESLKIRRANMEDIGQLVMLVNSAYRGNTSRKGWTHEADLIDGDKRITAEALNKLIKKPGTNIFVASSNNEIIGCVLLEKQDKDLYLGMLSVSPYVQGKGTGKLLLQHAELFAGQEGMMAIVMTVISVRHELIAWYNKHGFKDEGKRKPFPDNEEFGKPKQKLEFAVLRKQLG